MNAGEITSIIQVCGTIINPFFAISYIIKAIANTKSTRDKISKIIAIPTPKNSSPRLHVNKISVQNLSFSYTNKQNVINNLSFNFNLGDIVAIVGESGSGKSTLLSLLSKFIDGYTGLILINDSVNLVDISDETYYLNIKVLNQEPILLNDSIKNNIILDRPFDEQKFNEIFKLLNLGKSFEDINTKIDTEIKNYSLGEARRICLARLLYEKPNFILLDEPFASLDEENRLIIENALVNINDSCIVIASHVFSDNFKNYIDKKIEL